MTPEEIAKIEKKIEKRRKLTKKYQQEKLQNYENNNVRNETIAHIINNKDELIIKRNKNSLDYYYKNKDELDKKRKELYQQNKERINQENRVLAKCKKILKYEIV
jgi:DNA repair ATPase RecN